jgi:hypothetical protein
MSEADNPMHKVITKCWEDEAFKARLLADPAATLAAEGVQVPEGVIVNVVIDAEDERTLVIPRPPGEMMDGELSAVWGGGKLHKFDLHHRCPGDAGRCIWFETGSQPSPVELPIEMDGA